MLPFDPGDSVIEIYRGQHLRRRAHVRIEERVETGLKRERAGLSGEGLAEARVAEVDDVDEAGA
jgi:hypothetical protein